MLPELKTRREGTSQPAVPAVFAKAADLGCERREFNALVADEMG